MAKKSKKLKGDGIVYSTNNEFEYNNDGESDDVVTPEDQHLKIIFEKKGRGGKQVTLVRGFVGSEEDLKELGKFLKVKCGVGGSVADGEILIQGDVRNKIVELLKNKGFHVKLAGG